MLTLSVKTLLEVTGGELLAGSDPAMVNGLAIDSREVTPGAAFVAFAGEQADGHSFLGDAVERGARALLVTRDDETARAAVESARHGVALVLVADPTGAVQSLGRYKRSRLACPVVGVTGSNGKTTTKDFLFSALTNRLEVVATSGNRNNELGVPLTLMEAGADTDVAVVEMGMRAAGEIAALCEIAKPTHGLVTNVGQTHIESLGSQDAIADAKGELVEAIPAGGRVYLNGDDAWSRLLAERSAAKVVYYGTTEACDVRGVDMVVAEEDGTVSFTLVTEAGEQGVRLPIPGRHNVYNALAAAAVALDLGSSLSEIAEGIACASITGMRMEVFTSASGIVVVNDAYNASPASMRAALQTLADMPSDRARVAVLGDMAELGSLSDLAHFRIGESVASLGLDALVTVGDKARRIGEGAVAEGMEPDRVRRCVTVDEAVEVLDDLLERGDTVLVKASRVMGLERVVEGIVQPRV